MHRINEKLYTRALGEVATWLRENYPGMLNVEKRAEESLSISLDSVALNCNWLNAFLKKEQQSSIATKILSSAVFSEHARNKAKEVMEQARETTRKEYGELLLSFFTMIGVGTETGNKIVDLYPLS
jgi:hypothetical protein